MLRSVFQRENPSHYPWEWEIVRSEEHSSYVISSQELRLIFALTFSRLKGKKSNEQWHVCVFLSIVLSWKGVRSPKDGTILVRQCLISLVSLQMSKSHSSTEWEKKNPSKTPKSESFLYATPSHCSALTLPLGIPRLHLHTLLSRSLLALSQDNLALMPTGWIS